MKFTLWIKLVLVTAFLSACGNGGLLPAGTQTSSLPTAQTTVIHSPKAEPVLRASTWMRRWSKDYPGMYALLTQASRAVDQPGGLCQALHGCPEHHEP